MLFTSIGNGDWACDTPIGRYVIERTYNKSTPWKLICPDGTESTHRDYELAKFDATAHYKQNKPSSK
jgi:hypothetical protein